MGSIKIVNIKDYKNFRRLPSIHNIIAVVTDVHTVMVLSDVPAGSYTVTIGLYLPENGAHLTAGGEPQFSLGTPTPRLSGQ